MGTVTNTDGTEIFYKDWGSGQPIVFSHSWPLSADDWDSSQTGGGHDMDHWADDLAAVTARRARSRGRHPRRELHRRRRSGGATSPAMARTAWPKRS